MQKKFTLGICVLLLPGIIFAKTRIMGKSHCTEHQMRQYLLKKNPKVDQKYLTYAKYFLDEGKKEGVRGDLAFAQSLHETNYFKFGGDVQPSQNNFAGLGATGNKEPGLSFKTPQEGIRAQIQHLKAYASKKNLNQRCVDPRFKLVKKRGCAPYIENLSGLWAFPGYDTKTYKSLKVALKHRDSYGHKIQRICSEMCKIR
ncbi:MAG: glucosaminidase domain-containing protein [bacterium]